MDCYKMYPLLIQQYQIIKGARHALFSYCQTMGNDIFKKIDIFNNNCIGDLLVHNANTYISWLDNFGLDGTRAFHSGSDVSSLEEIKVIFEQVDAIVNDFLNKYSDDYLQPETKHIVRKGITLTLTPLQLFTHVI